MRWPHRHQWTADMANSFHLGRGALKPPKVSDPSQVGLRRTGRWSSVKALCIICRWQPMRRNQRCTTCSTYLRKYGKDRTEEQVVEHGRRVFERSIAC